MAKLYKHVIIYETNLQYYETFMKHTLMLNPALALVSINITPRSFALPSPSSIETCLFHEIQQDFSKNIRTQFFRLVGY
jgi:hypothetical protein